MAVAVSVAAHKASFRRIPEEIFNAGVLEAAKEIIAADYIEHIPLPPGLTPDRAGFLQFVEIWRRAVPDLEYTITPFGDGDLIGEGSLVMHRVTGRGTHLGEMFGIPPTSRPLEWTEMHIGRFESGMLAEHWGVIDVHRILSAVGAAPQGAAPPTDELDSTTPEGESPVRARVAELAVTELRDAWEREHMHDPLAAPYRVAFPDLRVDLDALIVESPFAVTRARLRGSHDGIFLGIPPTGRKVEFEVIEVVRVSAQAVTRRWSLADSMAALSRITS